MNSNVLYATSTMAAAFGSVDMTRVRACDLPGVRVPQRKPLDGNQHIFMIQTGAVGAGASGPSPWGCPV